MYTFIDPVLHIVLGLIFMWLIALYISATGVRTMVDAMQQGSILSSFIIYFREVTQYQSMNFDSNFFVGWIPWFGDTAWSLSKQTETFIPILVLLIVPKLLKWLTRKGLAAH